MALLFLSLEAYAGPLLLQMDQEVSGEAPSQVILGYDTVGGSTTNFTSACNKYTNTGATFTLTKGYVYTTSSYDFVMSVWSVDGSGDPDTNIACSDVNDSADGGGSWRAVDFTGGDQISIVNGTDYWICFNNSSGSFVRYYDAAGSIDTYYYNLGNLTCDGQLNYSTYDRWYSMYISNQ